MRNVGVFSGQVRRTVRLDRSKEDAMRLALFLLFATPLLLITAFPDFAECG